jgi:outer membrane lipoprotein-sorting protein
MPTGRTHPPRRRSRGAALVALALALFAPAAAATPLDDALRRIERARGDVRSMTADFDQDKVLRLFAESVRSQGRLIVQRPDRLRWEVRTPDASLFLLVGTRMRYRLPGARGQVEAGATGALGAVLRDLVGFLAGPLADLRDRYRLSLAGTGPTVLTAVPAAEPLSRSVRAVRLRFAADERVVEAVTLEEPGGDRSEIRFRNVRLNARIAPSAFALSD